MSVITTGSVIWERMTVNGQITVDIFQSV